MMRIILFCSHSHVPAGHLGLNLLQKTWYSRSFSSTNVEHGVEISTKKLLTKLYAFVCPYLQNSTNI
jgi:hypothetical protein